MSCREKHPAVRMLGYIKEEITIIKKKNDTAWILYIGSDQIPYLVDSDLIELIYKTIGNLAKLQSEELVEADRPTT